MKNLNFKITKWQTALFIALILIGQGAYSTDNVKITQQDNCVEALSPVAKLKGKVNSIKDRTVGFGKELYKTKGMRLFLVDVDPDAKNFHNLFITHAPFIKKGNIFSRLKNALSLLNPFRWIGAVIKNHKYKFSPLTSSLNRMIERLSRKNINNPKQLSRFSVFLVQATFILTILDPSLNALSDHIEERVLKENIEYVEQNKEYYQYILDTDYRYATLDKYMRNQMELIAVNLLNKFNNMEGMDTISTGELGRAEEDEYYNTSRDSVINEVLVETFLLESEYKIWKEKLGEIDIENLSLETNKSQFCDLTLFYESCNMAEHTNSSEYPAVVNESFNLTHDLYVSYDIVDTFTTNHIFDIAKVENLYINNAKQFIEQLVGLKKQGLIDSNALNYLIKQDAHVQFTLKINVINAALSGQISTREEIQTANLQASETLHLARQAIIIDIMRR